MRILIASDLHGSLPATEKVLKAYKELNADHLILLGDLLNHGPRNPIPDGYAPAKVAEKLNEMADHILAVRGNCDSDVDQMLLNFPMMSDFSWLILESGVRLFLTHGHLYHKDVLPPLANGDVFVHGHTHIPVADPEREIWIFNPGSTTFPKANFVTSFGLYENNTLKVMDFDYQVIKELKLK
ncbi:phosphodiesterase [Vibrio salinus]|uniref:phosphodiesterase n=1 Tax=Vibrio salinus TaxID=2899784 RepID=UPI001E301D3E|nr:phosphodiesterase [Vibrio salinus]MCE0492993.1 phosphodiesterase [Vibrio salinus]